jgi:hypothetical protein
MKMGLVLMYLPLSEVLTDWWQLVRSFGTLGPSTTLLSSEQSSLSVADCTEESRNNFRSAGYVLACVTGSTEGF